MLTLVSASVFTVQAQDGDLLGRVNSLRASQGLPGYTTNGALAVAAQQQAQWIVDNENVSHTHPDGSGPRTRALAAGYPSTQVSENIYGGTNATADSAWTFWLNSSIHYAGLVSTNYQEIGIGIARGSRFSAYVLVFGGAGAPYIPSSSNNSGNGSNQGAAAAAPPAYVGGLDENGNIMHIVQPGDTLGDIALIYGYTWDDLPYMMQINGLSDVRDLEVGSTFLVPSSAGTYTPTPDDRPPTETPIPTDIPPSITPFTVPSITPFVAVTNTPQAQDQVIPTPVIATAGAEMPPPSPGEEATITAVPEIRATSIIATAGADVAPPMFDNNDLTPSAGATVVAAVPTPGDMRVVAASMQPRNATSTWLLVALAVQVVVLIGAGIEFGRRALRRRK